MPEFSIEFTEDAAEDLDYLPPKDQRMVVARIKEQLTHEPNKQTRNRKPLRQNEISSWELRIGKYRIYDVDESRILVTVVAVGCKEHNQLFIRGKVREI